MEITKRVKQYLKANPWPEEPLTIGPGSCGRGCRTQHAYGYAVGQTSLRPETEVAYYFVYDRPCNVHESARELAQRREMGLNERR